MIIHPGEVVEFETEQGDLVQLPYPVLSEMVRKLLAGKSPAGKRYSHIRALKAYLAAMKTGVWLGGREISKYRVSVKAQDYYNTAISEGVEFTTEELQLYAQIIEECR